MSLNATPSADRLHIGIFGRRNAGKSSLMNAITGQQLSIVSDVRGTTTDPVLKAMELLPIGPVMLIDTPGLDDEGALGEQRVQKSLQALYKTDVALIVTDRTQPFAQEDRSLVEQCLRLQIPCCIVQNKSDLAREEDFSAFPGQITRIFVSAKTGEGIDKLKQWIIQAAPKEFGQGKLIGDLVKPLSSVVLVVPIDESAPKGRLILPQQKVIRELLDMHAIAVVCRESEVGKTLEGLAKPPALVVTDSQAFAQVDAAVPKQIPLTSFSILFARQSGVLLNSAAGVKQISKLKDGDRVLICEGCTHHRQCGDIGSVKIPRWLEQRTKKTFQYDFASGADFPQDLSCYQLMIHCGGCMLQNREIVRRMKMAQQQGVPAVNYGVLIAYLKGILPRSVELFPKALAALSSETTPPFS